MSGAALVLAASTPAGGGPRQRRETPPSMHSLSVGGTADRVAVGPSGVWVGDLSRLARVDPTSEAIVEVPGATTPIGVGAAAVFAGVYTRPDTVGRVDPTGARVGTTITVGGSPAAVAVAGASLFVLDAGGTLTRLDATTGTVTGQRPLGSFGFALAVAGGAVWASGRTADPNAGPLGSLRAPHTQAVLWRVDPVTLGVVATIPTGANCDALAASDAVAWAGCGTARRIDASADRLVSTKAGALNGIAVGEGAAWALSPDGTVTRLDASTGRVVGTIVVPSGSEGIAAGDGALWVANPHLHDPPTEQGTATLLRVAVGAGGGG
ncbi:MAG TPA: hypothetical protein VG012_03995 [Acidimicrobiia bacterium]|nr:hypothetical protein [Acidimicrobiia bacterium]